MAESPEQSAMLSACKTGNLISLQTYFTKLQIYRGTPPIDPHYITYPTSLSPIPPTGPPSAPSMLLLAIQNAHPAILSFLLSTYPTLNIQRENLMHAAFACCRDIPTLKALQAHDPAIIHYDGFGDHSTALIASCQGGDPVLVMYLLEQGADPNEGGLGGHMGPLWAAVVEGQPVRVVEEMVRRGAVVRPLVVVEAAKRERGDVVGFLLGKCRLSDEQKESVRRIAQETGEKELLSIVDAGIRRNERTRTGIRALWQSLSRTVR